MNWQQERRILGITGYLGFVYRPVFHENTEEHNVLRKLDLCPSGEVMGDTAL
jgi:hypothetical protein